VATITKKKKNHPRMEKRTPNRCVSRGKGGQEGKVKLKGGRGEKKLLGQNSNTTIKRRKKTLQPGVTEKKLNHSRKGATKKKGGGGSRTLVLLRARGSHRRKTIRRSTPVSLVSKGRGNSIRTKPWRGKRGGCIREI